jgi:hypothetical protein
MIEGTGRDVVDWPHQVILLYDSVLCFVHHRVKLTAVIFGESLVAVGSFTPAMAVRLKSELIQPTLSHRPTVTEDVFNIKIQEDVLERTNRLFSLHCLTML